jgi:hypothetical protein
MGYKLSTVDSKCVHESERYVNESGQQIIFSRLWRWGIAYSDDPIEIPDDYDPEEGVDIYDEFNLSDSEEDDCCVEELIFSPDIDSKQEKKIMKAYEKDGFEGLDALGFHPLDREVIYKGELNIDEIE